MQIYSKVTGGTGVLPANTTVSSINTANKTFVISAAPTTALLGARLCGGACAYFNEPSSSSSSTAFSVTKSSGTTQWAGGFTCLSGVDKPNIIPVTSTTLQSRNWSETVQ